MTWADNTWMTPGDMSDDIKAVWSAALQSVLADPLCFGNE